MAISPQNRAAAVMVPDNGIRAQAIRPELDEWRSEMCALNNRMISRMESIILMLKGDQWKGKEQILPSGSIIGASPSTFDLGAGIDTSPTSPSTPISLTFSRSSSSTPMTIIDVLLPMPIPSPSPLEASSSITISLSSPATFPASSPSYETSLYPQIQPPIPLPASERHMFDEILQPPDSGEPSGKLLLQSHLDISTSQKLCLKCRRDVPTRRINRHVSISIPIGAIYLDPPPPLSFSSLNSDDLIAAILYYNTPFIFITHSLYIESLAVHELDGDSRHSRPPDSNLDHSQSSPNIPRQAPCLLDGDDYRLENSIAAFETLELMREVLLWVLASVVDSALMLGILYGLVGMIVAYSAPTRHLCLMVVENNCCASKRGGARCLSLLNFVFAVVFGLMALFLGSSLLMLGSSCSIPFFWCYKIASGGLVNLFGCTSFILRRKAAVILDEYGFDSVAMIATGMLWHAFVIQQIFAQLVLQGRFTCEVG